MSPAVQIVDSLWQCLFPSFRSTYRLYSKLRCINALGVTQNVPRLSPKYLQTAHYTPASHQSTSIQNVSVEDRHPLSFTRRTPPQSLRFEINKTNGRPPDDPNARIYDLIRGSNGEELHNLLRYYSYVGSYNWTKVLVQFLIRDRGEEPDSRHYYALILANTDPVEGSVDQVEYLLKEMEDTQVPIDSTTYHAVLKVLSIHPSYILRSNIFTKMKENWMSLTEDGWAYLVAGQLRDKQIELALESLNNMRVQGYAPPVWLVNLLLHATLSVSAFEEAEALLSLRLSLATPNSPVPSSLWSHILTISAENLYHPLVSFAWNRVVTDSFLNPPSGVCTLVLESCARSGDTEVATDVFRVLGQRSSPIQPYHYESLIETYLTAGDVASALTVFSIMAKTPYPPNDATARPLYLYLRSNPNELAKIRTTLRSHARKGDFAPLCAINALIEAYVFLNDASSAMAVYKSLTTVVARDVKPTTHTLNTLLEAYKSPDSAEDDRRTNSRTPQRQFSSTLSSSAGSNINRAANARFLASEMRALRLQPNALTYDRLILAYLSEPGVANLDNAWRYFEEMINTRKPVDRTVTAESSLKSSNGGPEAVEQGWFPCVGTMKALARALAKEKDERLWTLLAEGDERGMLEKGVEKMVKESWLGGKGRESVEEKEASIERGVVRGREAEEAEEEIRPSKWDWWEELRGKEKEKAKLRRAH